MKDTTPWGGDAQHVSPPVWAFPAEHARRIRTSGDQRREGVVARHAWTAAIRWVLQHPDVAAWVAAEQEKKP
jgi:hypothetical protein